MYTLSLHTVHVSVSVHRGTHVHTYVLHKSLNVHTYVRTVAQRRSTGAHTMEFIILCIFHFNSQGLCNYVRMHTHKYTHV